MIDMLIFDFGAVVQSNRAQCDQSLLLECALTCDCKITFRANCSRTWLKDPVANARQRRFASQWHWRVMTLQFSRVKSWVAVCSCFCEIGLTATTWKLFNAIQGLLWRVLPFCSWVIYSCSWFTKWSITLGCCAVPEQCQACHIQLEIMLKY